MAHQMVEAIYEQGTLRLLDSLDMKDGQRVRVTIEPVESQEDPLELLRNIYAGLPEAEVDEIERIILDRSNWSRDKSLR